LVRSGRKHPAAAPFGNDGLIIESGVEAEQRKLEAILTARLAVAPARVAAMARKKRLDLVGEVDRLLAAVLCDTDRDRHLRIAVSNDNLGHPGRDRLDIAARVDADDRWLTRLVRRAPRHVLHPAAGEQLPALVGIRKPQFRWRNREQLGNRRIRTIRRS
jgi:hypothetical protein